MITLAGRELKQKCLLLTAYFTRHKAMTLALCMASVALLLQDISGSQDAVGGIMKRAA